VCAGPSLLLTWLQVVVDAFDPSVLVSDCATHVFDFATMKETELHDINIPLNLVVGELLRIADIRQATS